MEKHAHQPVKDEERELPIADAWRPTIREIARAFAEGDYGLSRGIPHVAPLGSGMAPFIRGNVEAYGETLTELSDETWDSSIALWMGDYWEVLVDLWTVEAGRSDLALHLRVFEDGEGVRFEVDSVHVP